MAAGQPRRSVTALVRDGLRIDRSQSAPLVALRNAVGIAAPLAIGAVAGNAAFGLAATIGALQAGFADRPGPYLLRTLRLLGVSLAAAVTSALAVVASGSDLGSAALVLVLAFGAGLLLTAGPGATQLGIATTATALVLGHTPQPPSVAWHVGLLVLAGGVGQTLLAVAAWPLGRHRPERVALAALYRQLAAAARRQAGSAAGPPAGEALDAARRTLYGLGHDHGVSVEAYRVLLDEADRLRRELVVLTACAERLAEAGAPILAGLVRGSLSAAADVFDGVAGALQRGGRIDPAVPERARQVIRHAVSRLEGSADAPAEATRLATAARLQALSGQLRAAVESTVAGASEGRRGAARTNRTGPRLRELGESLRANLTPSSAVLRHAVRLAVLVAGTDYVVRLAGIDRGYWLGLTLVVVLRPDFGTTLQRSVLRVVGTMVGLLLATALVHWVPGGDWWNVALVAVFAFGMRLAGPGNVALSAVSLSSLVVILLAIEGVAPHDTVVARAVATVVGGALAVAAVLAAPSWERQVLPRRLADLLTAYRDYLTALADPSATATRLQAARAACRLARSNAQVSLDRARAEPVAAGVEVDLGRTVLVHSHRLINAAIELDAVRRTVREAGGLPRLRKFLLAAADTLGRLAPAVRDLSPPDRHTGLRERQEQLAKDLRDRPATAGGPRTATTVAEATDRITNTIDTLAVELHRRLREGDPEAQEAPR